MYGGAVAEDQADMDRIASDVARKFRSEIGRGQVRILRLTSEEAAGQVADESLDWAYIDGDHTYKGVATDLRAWWPKLRSGGLLMGDDYGRSGWWGNGVQDAVTHFLTDTGPDADLALVRHSQFVCAKA